MNDCGGHDHCQRDELLARVEASEWVVEAARAFSDEIERSGFSEATREALASLRAALACPPQQRGEK